MTGRYSSTNDMGEFSIWALVITIVVFVCVAFLAVGFGFLNIPLKGLERQAIQQSPGYVEAKQHTLIDLKAQYLRLETDASTKYAGNDDAVKSIHSQQRQILMQMDEEKSLISEEAVPSDIREFLREHPQQ